MNADAVFFQGSSHPVCQDYAAVHSNRAGTFAFLADGCSGSKLTDFGSRFLVHSAMQVADDWEGLFQKDPAAFCYETFSHRAVWIADSYRKMLDLNPNCIDATLLSMFCNGENLYATIYGDGYLVLGYKNEDGDYSYFYYVVDYPKGYPNYPSYEIDTGRKCEYVNLSLGEVDFRTELIKPINYKIGAYNNKVETILSPVNDILLPAAFKVDMEGLVFAAMLSDGLDTFYHQQADETSTTNIRINSKDVIEEMFPFKNFHGVFLRRRLQRFFRDVKKKGWEHEDDLSVIAIGDLR